LIGISLCSYKDFGIVCNLFFKAPSRIKGRKTRRGLRSREEV
jgi:hypothetical protein